MVKEPKKTGTKKIYDDSEDKNQAVLFVFYNIHQEPPNDDNITWTKMPKGWNFTGSGSTQPITIVGQKKMKTSYDREDQYNGPKETKAKMKEYLDKAYSKMKEKNIITRYIIRNSYLPLPP